MIPFVDLKSQYRSIKDEIDPAVLSVLDSSQFVLGSEVRAFEDSFAEYCQAKHAVAVNSGTSALHLALLAAGIGPGDEVITTPMTFVATAAAILYAGARPVFVDIDPRSWNIDPGRIAAAITPRTKAIMPVHLHGRPADMMPIVELSHARGLVVIEDAAQAHGAEYGGQRIGTIGDIACFSFYPGKNLGAYGEGGAVVTNNPDYDATVRLLRDWGQKNKYEHVVKGYNYRMDGLQGAILRVKMKHIESWTQARCAHAAHYDRLLAGSGVVTPSQPVEANDIRHVYHVYAVRLANRDYVQKVMTEAGIATGIHYPVPVHLQPGYADDSFRLGDFPNAEQAGREFLSLPMFAELSSQQIEEVCRVLLSAAAPVKNSA